MSIISLTIICISSWLSVSSLGNSSFMFPINVLMLVLYMYLYFVVSLGFLVICSSASCLSPISMLNRYVWLIEVLVLLLLLMQKEKSVRSQKETVILIQTDPDKIPPLKERRSPDTEEEPGEKSFFISFAEAVMEKDSPEERDYNTK